MLPLEILKEIALDSPGAYVVLVSVCKGIAVSDAKKRFTSWRMGRPNDGFAYIAAWRLPNGHLHSITNTNDSLTSFGPPTIVICGESHWYQDDELHRDNDLPSIVNGRFLQWYRHGKSHRDGDLPAVVYPNGRRVWKKNGIIHRDGGPAIVDDTNYVYEWYQHGVKTNQVNW